MKKLIFLIFLLLPTSCFGWTNPYVAGCVTSVATCTDANPVGNCTGFLVCQNFETTAETCDPCTEDNSESWNKTLAGTGTITVDSASSLRGSQALVLDADGTNTISIYSPEFADSTTVYGFFRLQVDDGRPGTAQMFLNLIDVDGGSLSNIQLATTGKFLLKNGTGAAYSTTILDDGASGTLYIWFYWTMSSGSDDGTMGISINTTRTFTSWEATLSTGTDVKNIHQLKFSDRYVSGITIDQVLIKTTEIGTVCE